MRPRCKVGGRGASVVGSFTRLSAMVSVPLSDQYAEDRPEVVVLWYRNRNGDRFRRSYIPLEIVWRATGTRKVSFNCVNAKLD